MSALAVAAGAADREIDDLDLDLVAGVRAGDDRAFEALFLRYQPRIAAYVREGVARPHSRDEIEIEIVNLAIRGSCGDCQGRHGFLSLPWN